MLDAGIETRPCFRINKSDQIVSTDAAISRSFVKWIGQRLGVISAGHLMASNIVNSFPRRMDRTAGATDAA